MAAKPSTPPPSGPSERLRSAYEAVGEASAGRSAATLFSSFDLVNSTSYKTRAADDWPQVTQNFYYGVERAVESASSDEDDLRPEVWKYIGDEVVMLTEVFSVKDAERVVALTAAVCTALQNQFSAKDGATSLQRSEQLGVKASCWLALSASRTSNATRNIEFQPRVFPIRDFLGPDIDAGFRIGKRAMRGAVTLTAPLAQVLLDDGVGQSRHIRLAGYDVLKGVWDGRPYPVCFTAWTGTPSPRSSTTTS